ncbi:methylated-DNA--protein-cysteine methyltransferase [Lactobacillus pasteurii DSM 23907 = CRBIP 24.76]|uniref:Methylated-DNA--protein-cysteine methyltransferase n=1 Tax=Lactobacillus pasteurii DSM 23907 = CRBIP 24.76 TaxID=1423790 RepID=I7KKR1_9LACO|nr:methylated-DNA--[protein]-cysteine S-methyltransferase [Lactobacillus pasteurii]KRK07716.1 methylated-DNA--protein-cysteine methyltransferase [Lactobacillus pasteurii DSM 23907 = CRBIP 24.76]TDG77725.1 hypothetical protein C5L33_000136 [Lactobacillus pasteurii]CCI84724.1 Methylated-DNA--protein-cysteine methyltransferase [Lactobacillus pasteurii DSM 23907 = CRBIP 24.76]
MQTISYYDSPFGKILLASDQAGLTGLWFEDDRGYADNLTSEHRLGESSFVKDAKEWLDLYFAKQKPDFTPKLHLQGTDFQIKVWQELMKIPYGQVISYKDLAQKVSSDPKHLPIRAAGGAVGKNHITVIIPCHRVIGANNNLTGYRAGIEKKIQLLELEGINTKLFTNPR